MMMISKTTEAMSGGFNIVEEHRKKKKRTIIIVYSNISKLYIVERDEIEDTQPGTKRKVILID